MWLRTFAASALFLLGTTATVTAETDKVHACVNPRTGEVRLLVGAYCAAGTSLVVWNVPNPSQWPSGARGATGPQGPAGPAGPTGATGAPGATGATGAQGVAGPQGVAGTPGAAGAQGVAGPQGLQGVPGVAGPAGSVGPMGPAGPAATDVGQNGIEIVDQNGQEVGIATDPFAGLLMRHEGTDIVMFFASASGPSTGPLDFFHAAADCSDSRYLPIQGGAGFTYFASVHGGAVFYTTAIDPNVTPQVAIHAYEHFEQNDDATRPGVCTPVDGGMASLGTAIMALDPALANLALPLRIK